MMLNLLRVEKLRVQDMLKRSFSEFANRKDEGKDRTSLHELRRKVSSLQQLGNLLLQFNEFLLMLLLKQ